MVSGLTPFTELNRLRLVPPALAAFIPAGDRARTLLRGSDTPLYADPVLCWGSSSYFSAGKERGQIYNCTMPSQDNALDVDMTVDLIDFVNYMHDDLGDGSKWASLLLMKDSPSPAVTGVGNYVY